MAANPALAHAQHRIADLHDQRKQVEARFAAERDACKKLADEIDAELAGWDDLLANGLAAPAEKPAAKKAAAPKK